MSKLATARRVYQHNGIAGVFSTITRRLRDIPARLHSWWWAEHPLAGRVVEWRGNIVHVDGLRFSVSHPAISHGVKGLFLLGRYEKPERQVLACLDPDLPVVELGASLGVISCLTNKRLANPFKHVVVEANPDLINLLRANRDRNYCHFSVEHAAVAYGVPEVEFLLSDSILASSATQMDRRFNVIRTVQVPTTTLAGILDRYRFSKCNLICDIECGEVQLIEREIETIKAHVSMILIEIHHHELDDETVSRVIAKLIDAGFVLRYRLGKTYVFSSRAVERERASLNSPH